VSSEYEDWRLAYRNGPPGLPVPGRSAGRWIDEQKRLTKPYFVLIGACAAELRLPYRALSWHPDLFCHGQLFHPARIELANGLATFAGYGAEEAALRMVSAPNFVADIVRAEPKRMSGYLLKRGQGWHMTEVMVERPNVRMAFLRGDTLNAFIENVMQAELLMTDALDLRALEAIPPSAIANRFRRFLYDYDQYVAWMTKQSEKARTTKPAGWVRTLDVTQSAQIVMEELEAWLGVSLAEAPHGCAEADIAAELAEMAKRREVVTDMLMRGGINKDVFDTLRAQSESPAVAASLL
ncbi:MAG: hypothetical protein JO234_07155, partial [Hyphomicrobiales bacterium]|nr:hypothetical protein [Hyphomicrobiales bacterium]